MWLRQLHTLFPSNDKTEAVLKGSPQMIKIIWSTKYWLKEERQTQRPLLQRTTIWPVALSLGIPWNSEVPLKERKALVTFNLTHNKHKDSIRRIIQFCQIIINFHTWYIMGLQKKKKEEKIEGSSILLVQWVLLSWHLLLSEWKQESWEDPPLKNKTKQNQTSLGMHTFHSAKLHTMSIN